MKTLIGVSLRTPRKKSERPQLRYLYCELENPFKSCPVLRRGQCVSCQYLSRPCVYGRMAGREGWTRRAKKYRAWLQEAKAERDQGPKMPGSPDRKLAFIGDFVWLPYSHMAMCESVPFLAHGGAFRTEQPFVRRECFTPENIVKLVLFRPHAMTGGEIRCYQQKSLPQFLYDLMHTAPKLYAAAAKLNEAVEERTPRHDAYKDTKVPIMQVKAGTRCKYRDWPPFRWNGRRVEITLPDDQVIGLHPRDFQGSMVLGFTPSDGFTVLVLDDDELIRLYREGVFAA